MPLERPRLRDRQGREVALERYRRFQDDGARQRDVARRILAGVSTRQYERVLDDLCHGYGISKSAVSRQWRAASAATLQGLCERPLGELDLVVLMLDGIRFGDVVLAVGLGLDAQGRKHLLGLWQGDTENTTVVGEWLDDLIRRGWRVDPKYLFVLDGSKALAQGVRAKFGAEMLLPRCRVPKSKTRCGGRRNGLDHLPPRHRRRWAWRLKAAWNMKDYAAAKKELEDITRELSQINPSAAGSLEEGWEDRLTLHRSPQASRPRRPGPAGSIARQSAEHQLGREPVRGGAADYRAGEALAQRRSGLALGWQRPAGGREDLSTCERVCRHECVAESAGTRG